MEDTAEAIRVTPRSPPAAASPANDTRRTYASCPDARRDRRIDGIGSGWLLDDEARPGSRIRSPHDRSADPGVSTTALSNAPSAPPVSGVAAAPPNVTMPVKRQRDASNLPTYPGTSYPVTPYPATPTAANPAANVPTYGYAPNAARVARCRLRRCRSRPIRSRPRNLRVTPGMAPQGARRMVLPRTTRAAYGAAAAAVPVGLVATEPRLRVLRPRAASSAAHPGSELCRGAADAAVYSAGAVPPTIQSAPQQRACNAAAPQGTYTRA